MKHWEPPSKTCKICHKTIGKASLMAHWRFKHPVEYENYFVVDHGFGFMTVFVMGGYEPVLAEQ